MGMGIDVHERDYTKAAKYELYSGRVPLIRVRR
jgi:hypothetical protein